MGIDVVHGFIVELVLHLFALMITSWVVHKSWHYASKVTNKRENTKVGALPTKKTANKNQFVVNLTLFENVLYLVLCMVSTIGVSVYLSKAIKGQNIRPYSPKRGSFLDYWDALTYIIQGSAWVIISLIGFERLKGIFESTRYEVSSQCCSIMYTLIGLFSMTNTIPTIAYLIAGYQISVIIIFVICESLNFFLSAFINLWIIRRFMKNSEAIVRGVQANIDTRPGLRPLDSFSSTGYGRTSIPRVNPSFLWAEKLAHTALRVTISCSIPVISSMMVFFLSVIALPIDSNWMNFVLRWCVVMDWCTNTVGILFTYGDAKPFYDRVLGRLHHFIYLRMFVETK